MLIESSFYTLHDSLMSANWRLENESWLVGYFINAVQAQLQARGIPAINNCVRTEEYYSSQISDFNESFKFDVHINLDYIYNSRLYDYYGARINNWVEAKYFQSYSKKNSGVLQRDIIRLCCLIEEMQGEWRNVNGRYLLVAFKYDPTNRHDDIVNNLIHHGISNITLDIDNQDPEIRKGIGEGFLKKTHLIIQLETFTHSIVPVLREMNGNLYSIYLISIRNFTISMDDISLQCGYNKPGTHMLGEDIANQKIIKHKVISILKHKSKELEINDTFIDSK